MSDIAASTSKDNIEDISDPLQVFNEFYRQIIFIKKSLERDELKAEVANHLGISVTPSGHQMAEVVSSRLQYWIEKKRKTARRLLTEKEYSRINETLFVSAALADELFILTIKWLGSDSWSEYLLEKKVFNSSFSGERFFQGIAMLFNEKTLDEQQKNLMSVYFLSMRLGFSGRYRGDNKKLLYIRKRLYKRMNGGLSNKKDKVCPQSYEYLLSSSKEYRLAPLIRWKKTMTQAALLYVVTSIVVWVSIKGIWSTSL